MYYGVLRVITLLLIVNVMDVIFKEAVKQVFEEGGVVGIGLHSIHGMPEAGSVAMALVNPPHHANVQVNSCKYFITLCIFFKLEIAG